MADLKNSRNTQLNTSTIRLVSNQKAVTVTSPDLLVDYDSTGTLVAGQTLQVTAVKLNTVAPVVWSTSNSNVKLYDAVTGTTEVISDASTSGTSTVWLRASEFNAAALSSLTVTATVTDIDVVSGYVTFIKLQASPGSSTFTASLYLQNASYPAGTPPAAPVGGTFNFATGVLTAPTGTPQWTATQPATSTTPTWACEYNFTGTVTQTVTAGTWQNVRIDTVTGAAGTRTAILDLYRWSSTVPTTFPSGTSTYTWSTAQFAEKAGTTFTYNSWTTVPGTPVLGQTLYILRQVYADTGSSLTSDVAWSTTTPLPIAVSGTNGTRTGVLEVYKWSATQPTSSFPTGTSTYTWATGVFTLPATPNGWSLLPGASVAGSTLWAVQVTIANTSTTSTNTVTWPATPTAYAVGAAGIGGTSQNRVELYWQTATAPAVPTFTRYTFSTDTVSIIPSSGGSLGSWQRTPPDSTATPTWVTTCPFSVVAPGDVHDSSAWSTPVVYAQKGANGTPGTNGKKAIGVNAFLWSTSVPTIPTLNVTYTWSSNSVSAYPAVTPATSPATYWTGSAPAAPGTGYTLYMMTASLSNVDAAADTTDFNWSSATLNTIGYRQDGSIGPQGNSYRIAYIVTTNPALPTKPANTTGSTSLPAGTIVYDGITSSWSATATSNLTAGQYMYQTDGIYNPTAGTVVWGNPYLSNLNVGTLSAITANVGNLTVAEQGNIQTFNKGYGVAGGFFLGYDGTVNKFSIGDKLLYNGTTFSLPGITIGSSGGIDGIGTGNGTIVNNDAARPGGVNLVGNSGFLRNNSTLPTNWAVYNNSGIAVTSTVQTGGMFGQNYVRVTAGANTPTTLGIYVTQSTSDSVKTWEPGQTYCISFWARASAGAVGKLMYGLNSNMGWAASSANQLENPVLTAAWQRYVWRAIPANNANTAFGELYISVAEQGTTTPLPSGSVIDICCPKVELGTQPSSWTPSPQDTMNINLEPSIATAQTTATNAASAAATAQTTATNAASAAATANASIADISSDSLLTPDEKPQIIQDYDVIIAEKTGINSQATNYSVTTENTAYNTAVTALTTYLATLTTPVLWSTLSGNTTIVGATFRTKFKDVYTTRQALLDKISAAAKTLSDAAQTTANAQSTIKLNVGGTGLSVLGTSCTKSSGTNAWNAQCYSQNAYVGGASCSFSPATVTGQVVAGLSLVPTTSASYEPVTYAIYLDGSSNEISIREYGSSVTGFTALSGALSTTDVFSIVYDGQFVRYFKNGTVFRVSAAPPNLKLYFDSSVYTLGGGLTNIQLAGYANTNTSRGTSLIDPSWWKVGVDPNSYWDAAVDTGVVNVFVAATLPDSSTGTVWQATSGTSNRDNTGGGWVTGANLTNKFPVNTAKTYMFAVYTKSVSGAGVGNNSQGVATAGQEYFGIDNYNTTAICNLNTTTANINPYFASTVKVDGEWHLLVGYVYPAGSTGYTNAGAGAYRCSNGVKIVDGSNWTWAAGTTQTGTRAFQYYQPAGSIQQFVWPQVYLCDGSEPSIDDLLSMSSISARNPLTTSNKSTYGYSGDLDATKGAPSGTLVGSTLAQNVESTTGAQSKADAAQSNAVSTAATDATTKANAAQAAAIAAAAIDATNKAAAKLNKSAADTLSGPITVSTLGGIVAGSLTWDSTGTRTGGQGVAITPKGIVGHNGTKATFVIDSTSGDATFSGALSAASGNFTGAVYGGSYTNSYAWPAAGGTGFYLGASGLLFGTANGTNAKYFQVTGEGNVYAPGFSIVNGSASFSGTLASAIVNTDQIVGGAASVASTANTTGATLSVTVTVPANASAVLLDYYLGPPTQTVYTTGTDSGKDASFASGYVNGPILDSLKDNTVACSSIIISPSTGSHTYTVARSYYTGTMRLSVLILKR